MLDSRIQVALRPLMHKGADALHRFGLSPNQVSVLGCTLGLLAATAIALQTPILGLVLLLVSRILDGLDGALARLSGQTSDAGGFLDITLDFVFYASIPLGFAFAQPEQNALAAAVLLASFVGTGTSFLAYAIMAQKRGLESTDFPNKSFYFATALTEATETIGAFALMCLLPQHFATIASVFAALCCVTTLLRIRLGYQTFKAKA